MLAGASPLSWPHALAAALTGIVPQAVLYAIAGALAATLFQGALVFGAVLAAAAVLWVFFERPGQRWTGAA